MIIDLSKARTEYFADPTSASIVRQVWAPQEGEHNFSITRDLPRIKEQLTIGAEGSLEDLLNQNHKVNHAQLVDKIDALRDGLLVLPADYRLDQDTAHTTIAYSNDSLVKLDSIAVVRKILGPQQSRGRLGKKRKKENQWAPEKVISTAFDLLQEESNYERTLSSYSWRSSDNHRHIVSLYRAVAGAELRAFQNMAAFKLKVPVMRKELRLGKSAKTSYQEKLTIEEQNYKFGAVKQYEHYLDRRRREGRPLHHYLKQLDVTFEDLIEVIKGQSPGSAETFGKLGGHYMRVPSRSQRDVKFRKIKFTRVPLVTPENPAAYVAVWDMRANGYCEDKTYRSDRRVEEIDVGYDEHFWCPHEIAALHGLKRMYQKRYELGKSSKVIPLLPFVMPTSAMMKYVEKLRHQTILLERNPDSKKWHKRALNHTEIENLMWKRVVKHGYEANFTTDRAKLLSGGYDPQADLIGFV